MISILLFISAIENCTDGISHIKVEFILRIFEYWRASSYALSAAPSATAELAILISSIILEFPYPLIPVPQERCCPKLCIIKVYIRNFQRLKAHKIFAVSYSYRRFIDIYNKSTVAIISLGRIALVLAYVMAKSHAGALGDQRLRPA